MATGKINLQKASGGITAITGVDGASNTQLVLPESGTVSSVDTSVTDNAIARYDGTTGKLQNSSVTIDNNGNVGIGTQSFNGFGGTGFKNYIINGDMRIAQRGIGPFTANGYGIDQWFSYISGTSSVIRSWEGTGSNHLSYAQVSVGSGADIVTMEQRLENPHKFSGKTLTLSYKLFNGNYSGSGVTYKIALNHAGGRTLLFSGTSVFAGGDKKKVTFTVPDLSGYTLNTNSYLEIRPVEIIGNGYSGVFGITDIQLEEGSVATPFENRPYGLELSLCQRYYQVYGDSTQGIDIIGYSIAGQTERTSFMFPIQMRDNPNATKVGTWYASNCSQPTIATKSKNGFSLQTIVAATGGFEYTCNGTGQYLIFEKEL